MGLEFALPPLGGGYLDRRWGTGSFWTIVGAILGFLIGMAHLMTIARVAAKQTATEKLRDESNESGRADHG